MVALVPSSSVIIPHGQEHSWAAAWLEQIVCARTANVCVVFNLKEMHVFETVPRDLCAGPTL